MEWEILVKGIKRQMKLQGLDENAYTDVLRRIFAFDTDLIGEVTEAEPKALLQQIAYFILQINEEEMESTAMDGMLTIRESQPEEFAKHFSGISAITEFLIAIAKFRSDKPQPKLKCLMDRYPLAETLNIIESLIPEKQAYYTSGYPKVLAGLVEGAVTNELAVVAREMTKKSYKEGSGSKSAAAQQEYKYFVRPWNARCTAARETWADSDQKKAVVPLLYMMNVLNQGKAFQVMSALKKEDQGMWSPAHMDLFAAFADANRAKFISGKPTYLKAMLDTCKKMSGFPKIPQITKGISVQINELASAITNIESCRSQLRSKNENNTATQQFDALLAKAQTLKEQVEAIEVKMLQSTGATSARLVLGEGKNATKWIAASWERVRKGAHEFAEQEMAASAAEGPQATVAKQVGAAAIFDDFTFRNALADFCTDITASAKNVGSYFAVDNEPAAKS